MITHTAIGIHARMHSSPTPVRREIFLILAALMITACSSPPPPDRLRVSGHVEATEVQVASQVAGRILQIHVTEGNRVAPGTPLVTLDTADTMLALTRARAERSQAEAQLRLLQAGSRSEDIRQAEAQAASAEAEVAAAGVDLAAADEDVRRFESLLASNSGSRKQRDDAVARRDVARQRHAAAQQRALAARAAVSRLQAGSRPEEIAAARARVAFADAQLAILDKAIADATILSPVEGIVTERVADVGELVQPRTPLLVVTDLDHAWANVYVDEPAVPRLRLGQQATLFTDAGGEGVPGAISYISDKAEFTPRNVQTAEDRSQLVYRVKIAVNNSAGVLKTGMPVEAEIPFAQ
jgi:HlyD family secretion protein